MTFRVSVGMIWVGLAVLALVKRHHRAQGLPAPKGLIMNRMPALFIGHGSPMNTLESNRYTQAWRRWGATMPRPRCVLVVSAHWYIGVTAVTAMARPRTIHDFRGFPQALFDFQYPAPGAPDVAGEIVEVLKPEVVALDHAAWGLDHGTWSVLAHVYPQADVPVMQLSINAAQPIDWHLGLAARLQGLRDAGVLVLGSGNVVHNLGLIDWNRPDAGADWAVRFDEAAQALMHDAPGDIMKLAEHGDYALAVPTPDHFIPLLYLAALAAGSGGAQTLIEGYAYGSLSMTCFGVGMPA